MAGMIDRINTAAAGTVKNAQSGGQKEAEKYLVVTNRRGTVEVKVGDVLEQIKITRIENGVPYGIEKTAISNCPVVFKNGLWRPDLSKIKVGDVYFGVRVTHIKKGGAAEGVAYNDVIGNVRVRFGEDAIYPIASKMRASAKSLASLLLHVSRDATGDLFYGGIEESFDKIGMELITGVCSAGKHQAWQWGDDFFVNYEMGKTGKIKKIHHASTGMPQEFTIINSQILHRLCEKHPNLKSQIIDIMRRYSIEVSGGPRTGVEKWIQSRREGNYGPMLNDQARYRSRIKYGKILLKLLEPFESEISDIAAKLTTRGKTKGKLQEFREAAANGNGKSETTKGKKAETAKRMRRAGAEVTTVKTEAPRARDAKPVEVEVPKIDVKRLPKVRG